MNSHIRTLSLAVVVAAIGLSAASARAQEEETPRRSPFTSDPEFLSERVEVLTERLELTEQLGRIEVEILKLQLAGREEGRENVAAIEALHEAELAAAEQDLERLRQLVKKGFVSETQLAAARLEVEAIRAKLLETRTHRAERETENRTARLAIERREIETRLAVGEVRLDLLEAQRELQRARRFREFRGRDRDRDRETDDETEEDDD